MGNPKIEDIKVNVVDSKPCAVILSVEIPHPKVATETDKVYEELQKEARIPGFRLGKAPLDLVKKAYTATARERVVQNLVRQTVLSVLEAHGIEPIDFPEIEEIAFDFEKPFSFKMRAERHPEFKVKEYKAIKIKKEIQPVSEAKIRENLESLRERNARLVESKSDVVAANSFVMVDYECFQGAESLPELKTKNQLIDLSAPQMLAGFKEGLLGAKKDEEREIILKLPADYPNKKIADKEITFKVKVLAIKEKELPALDDELAKDFGFANLAELENKVKATLEAEEKKRQDQEVEKQIIDHLVGANEFPVPESLVHEQLHAIMNRMAAYFKRQGIPEEEIKKNESQWHEKYRAEAEKNVRISYILNAIAREEKIEITDEDLGREQEKMKQANPERNKEVEKYFTEQRKHISSNLKEEKIFKFIIENAKIKEEVKKD